MEELNYHIKKLRDKFGSFRYAAPNIPYDPNATYSHVSRSGELKPEIKKELGVPVKSEPKADKKDTSGESEKTGNESVVMSEVSSSSDVSERVVTPKGEVTETKPNVATDAKGTSAASTPVKALGKRMASDTGNPGCSAPKKSAVDLNSLQQADSRGVFEVSSEALSPEVTKILRNKLSDERILRSSPRNAVNKKSIVELLQKKMQEAEMESSDEKEDKKEGDDSAKSSSKTPSRRSSADHSRKSPDVTTADETSKAEVAPAVDKLPLVTSSDKPSDQSSPVLKPFEEGDCEKADFSGELPLDGTPKKNPLLANLVESCKAKLGITSEEELVSRSLLLNI